MRAPCNNSNPFSFDLEKAIQAVAFLLKQKPQTNCSDNYMRILKLLYFADRESIKETGTPITGDRFVALKYGPTLSRLLNLVRQEAPGGIEWDKFIQKVGYDIRLINDPGNGKLCKYEIELLRKIWNENRDLGEWDVATKSETFQEFIKNNPGDSQKPIPLTDLLEAVGRSDWLQGIIQASTESCSPI
ncbi:MAG: DUF4065 domain-containing protein [Planctomycetes bacterium]|nr:DUF4065 domain-containing protein [Planctomycetota bacterium]